MTDEQHPVAVAGVWEAYEDDSSGVLYFYNTQTQETQWEKPAAFSQSPSRETTRPRLSSSGEPSQKGHSDSIERNPLHNPQLRTSSESSPIRPAGFRSSSDSPEKHDVPPPHRPPGHNPRPLLPTPLGTSSDPYASNGSPQQHHTRPPHRPAGVNPHPLRPTPTSSEPNAPTKNRTPPKRPAGVNPHPAGTNPMFQTGTTAMAPAYSSNTTEVEWVAPREEWKPEKAKDFNPPEASSSEGQSAQYHEDMTGISRKYTTISRILVCTVAVALLWCTTFSVSKGIATTLLQSPGSEVVISSWETVIAITEDESAGHDLCARLQVERCNATYVSAKNRTTGESNERVANNTRVTKERSSNANSCEAQRVAALTTFRAFLEDNLILNQIYWNCAQGGTGCHEAKNPSDVPVCTQEERDRVQTLIGAFDVEVRKVAFTLTENYVSDTDKLIADFNAQIDARAQYDAEYIANKTGQLNLGILDVMSVPNPYVPGVPQLVNLSGAFADVEACLTGSEASQCPHGIGAMPVPNLGALQTRLNDSYVAARAVAAGVAGIGTSFASSVSSAYGVLVALLSKLSPIAGAIESALSNSISITAEFDSVLADFNGLTDGITFLGLLDFEIFARVEEFFDEARANARADLNARQQAVRASIDAQMQALAAQLNLTASQMRLYFADYNPPNVTWPASQHQTNTQTTVAEQRAVLEQPDTSASSRTVSLNETVLGALEGFDLVFSNVSFPWRVFGGTIDFGDIILAADQFIFFLLFADYAFRMLRTIRLIVKYWSYSAVGLPIIDVRKGETDTKSEPIAVKMGRIVTSPFFIIALASLLAVLAISLIVDAYLPLYNSYTTGCVDSADGTVFTNNTYAFSFNYAAYDGNRLLTDSIKEYDLRRSSDCADLRDQTVEQQAVWQSDYDDAGATRNRAVVDLNLLTKCVDFGATFKDVRWDVYNTKQNNEDVKPGEQIDTALNGECEESLYSEELVDARFNCSLLPPCYTTCSGPNQYLLAQASFEAGCRTESLIHAGMWQGLTTFIVYVCINLSRVFAVLAITRLFWRSLTPHGFSYQANCDRKGRAGKEVRKLLPREVSKGIRAYEREAMFYLLAAMIVHIPYIVIFNVIDNPLDESNNLAYSGDGLQES